MLENITEKYFTLIDNRYSICQRVSNSDKDGTLDTAINSFGTFIQPKAFLDGAIVGSIIGGAIFIYTQEDNLPYFTIALFSTGLLNQAQYATMLLLEEFTGIVSNYSKKEKNKNNLK